MRTRNLFPHANSAAEKAAEGRMFSAGYYREEAFRHWVTHPYRRHTIRHLVAHLRSARGSRYLRVLEPACGCGVNLHNLARDFPDFRLTGVELSAQGVETARSLSVGEYLQGDAEELDFEDGAFDLVLSIAAVHHFTRDPRCFLFECFRVLAPGGRLYLLEPHQAAAVRPEWAAAEEHVRAAIRAVNPRPPAAAVEGRTPRAPTEGRFDRECTVAFLRGLGLCLLSEGHTDYLTEWCRGYARGFGLARAFDRVAVEGGQKLWAVFWKGGAA